MNEMLPDMTSYGMLYRCCTPPKRKQTNKEKTEIQQIFNFDSIKQCMHIEPTLKKIKKKYLDF